MNDVLLVVVIVVALGFDFTNGFHDTANAVATSVSTRALTPRMAVLVASVANLAGAFVTTAVAKTVGKDVVDSGLITTKTVLAALLGAIAWNLLTWWFGLPSSSSHALIGGLVGAALVHSGSDGVLWHGLAHKIVIPALVAPLIAFTAAFALMLVIYWVFSRITRGVANRGFRFGQLASGTFMAFTHGANDAQKTMGVIALALFANGNLKEFEIPTWVKVAAGLSIGLGTYVGGWRIMRTRGRRHDLCGHALRLSALDDSRDLGCRHGRGVDPEALSSALGSCWEHCHCLDPHDPGGRGSRGGVLLADPGDLLSHHGGRAAPPPYRKAEVFRCIPAEINFSRSTTTKGGMNAWASSGSS